MDPPGWNRRDPIHAEFAGTAVAAILVAAVSPVPGDMRTADGVCRMVCADQPSAVRNGVRRDLLRKLCGRLRRAVEAMGSCRDASIGRNNHHRPSANSPATRLRRTAIQSSVYHLPQRVPAGVPARRPRAISSPLGRAGNRVCTCEHGGIGAYLGL